MTCEISPEFKDYQVAKGMFGDVLFTSSKEQSKALCHLVKKLRRKPLEVLERFEEAAVVLAQGEQIWYIGLEHLKIKK